MPRVSQFSFDLQRSVRVKRMAISKYSGSSSVRFKFSSDCHLQNRSKVFDAELLTNCLVYYNGKDEIQSLNSIFEIQVSVHEFFIL